MNKKRDILFHIYMALFLAYLLVPLIIMGGAAFNDNKVPSVVPWKGFTLHWFVELWHDDRIWIAFRNTIVVALFVAVISVPIGTAAAILVNSVNGRIRAVLYGFMVAPILAPGIVIGVSTLLFWNMLGVGSGLHLSVLGQVSYIAAFVMLLVLARLQSFDAGLEEAALDLGASHGQVMRRILMPHLYPAMAAGAAIAFFQSIENFNITLFTRGNADTLTVYVFSKVRTGFPPTINALALLLIVVTLAAAAFYELRRRRVARIEAAREEEGRRAADAELV
jgi:spermidine/putrescine transport system permease protein